MLGDVDSLVGYYLTVLHILHFSVLENIQVLQYIIIFLQILTNGYEIKGSVAHHDQFIGIVRTQGLYHGSARGQTVTDPGEDLVLFFILGLLLCFRYQCVHFLLRISPGNLCRTLRLTARFRCCCQIICVILELAVDPGIQDSGNIGHQHQY